MQLASLDPPRGDAPRRARPAWRPRRLSDAALLACLVAETRDERRLLSRRFRERIKSIGLSAMAHAPETSWAEEWDMPQDQRRRIEAAFELGRRVFGHGGPPLGRPEDVYRLAFDLRRSHRERFIALYLDARHRILLRRTVSVGTLTASLVHPREVFAPALRCRAAALVAVHNHPSGDPEPSPEDIALTDRLREAGRIIGIELLDHVVVGRDGYVSFRERGWLPG